MDSTIIGKLERVALREVWKHEAQDFTQWLQQNIEVLNDALDLTMINVERERASVILRRRMQRRDVLTYRPR
jgi:hypothetical protein